MRKVLFAISLLMFIVGSASSTRAQGGLDQRVSELSQQIAAKMSAKQKTTVAVVEFTDLQGNVTDLGRFLAEELITRLGDLEKFKVIERQLLTKIITEQKLSLTGVVDPASAKQLGKILGVDSIVSGTMTNLAQSVRVNARLISTETGEVFATAAADIFKDESVTGLLSGGSSAPASGKSTPIQSDAANKGHRKVTVRDFIVELESCRMSASAVVCSMTITNDASTDRTVKFHTRTSSRSPSRLLDEFGGEYGASKVQIGGRVSQVYLIGPAVTSSLVPRVPTKLIITFDTVSPEAKTVTFLRVAFQWSDSSSVDLNADFRGIAITK